MTYSNDGEGAELLLDGAGGRLRRAREQAGLSLEQVAAQTRIPARHLEVIESGDFDRLPARTYAIGFSRSYARLVGLDEREIATQVREELAHGERDRSDRGSRFEPGDPAKVPSRGLAWLGLLAAVLLVGGGFAFYRTYFAPGMGPPPLQPDPPAAQATAGAGTAGATAASAPSANPGGPVVLTSREDGMWVRIYDGTEDTVLLEKLMAKGETFTIPADAADPRVRTGRPDAFDVAVGGRRLAPLADRQFVMSAEPVSAQALLARGESGAGTDSARPATAAPASGTTAD